jgi:hypothetical protein
MRRILSVLTLISALLSLNTVPAVAAIDLQADLDRVVVGIRKFDANSAAVKSIKTMADARAIFSKNSSILKEIENANVAFARDLNSAKKYISNRDTKDSPAFNTLINLTKGYKEWLRYQNINQNSAQKCINMSGNSYTSFSYCLISILDKTMENERLGRLKLVNAWDAWKQWQVKYGYA